jgi:hypothetical protein
VLQVSHAQQQEAFAWWCLGDAQVPWVHHVRQNSSANYQHHTHQLHDLRASQLYMITMNAPVSPATLKPLRILIQ